MTERELCRAALAARENAYAPYSGFAVGAALLTADGKVYTGCNIENAAYTPTVCAERTAIFKAVSEGKRQFCMLAVAGGKKSAVAAPCPPCGVCRQVLAEFCAADMPVLLAESETQYTRTTVGELLPFSFSSATLGK